MLKQKSPRRNNNASSTPSPSKKSSYTIMRDTSGSAPTESNSSMSSSGSNSEEEHVLLLSHQEAIREHRVILQRSSPRDQLMGRIMETKQRVFVPSAKQKWLHQRRKKTSCMRKYVVALLALVGMVALANVTDDLAASLQMSRHNSARALIMQHDYSNMSLEETNFGELVQEVDSWCLEPDGSSSASNMGLGLGSSDCTTCQDPSQPASRKHLSHWKRAHTLNLKQRKKQSNPSILFLGDSITEGWRGTSYGVGIARTEGISKVFEEYFPGSVAVGIAGDTCPNLLWRIQHGELGDGGQHREDQASSTTTTTSTASTTTNLAPPKMVVLLIGTNDLGNDFCSPEMVVLGILSVVQELRSRLPSTSTILVHGLLPRTFDRKGNVLKGRRTPWILGGGWQTPTANSPSSVRSKSGRSGRRTRRRRKSALPSLWNDVREINFQLQRFVLAQNTTTLQYYNLPIHTWLNHYETADDDSDDQDGEQRLILNATLMPDYLHPSKVGYQVWAQSLKVETDRILREQKETAAAAASYGMFSSYGNGDGWF